MIQLGACCYWQYCRPRRLPGTPTASLFCVQWQCSTKTLPHSSSCHYQGTVILAGDIVSLGSLSLPKNGLPGQHWQQSPSPSQSFSSRAGRPWTVPVADGPVSSSGQYP
eukprot:3485646-Rhodomonas_salina.2